MLEKLDKWSDDLLWVTQRVLGSKVYFYGVIVGTVAWMLLNVFLPHPIDNPRDMFPGTVLSYTLMSLWIENAMKVQQHSIQEQMQRQIDRIEELVLATSEQTEMLRQVMTQQQTVLGEMSARDVLMARIVTSIDDTVDNLYNIVKQGQS